MILGVQNPFYHSMTNLEFRVFRESTGSVRWNFVVCECVRSNSNFHPRNQDVDFDMLEMLFSFQCAKYDKNRWLNWSLRMGQMGPKMTPGTLKMNGNEWGWHSRRSGAQITFTVLLATQWQSVLLTKNPNSKYQGILGLGLPCKI